MKSKFSEVVKVRKQALDKAEAKLALARSKVESCEQSLAAAREEALKFSLPKSGNVNEIRQNLELLNVARNAQAQAAERLELAKKEAMHFEFLYKKANLEFEKMKYLEEEELRAQIKKAQRAEALALDEFAVMKFAAKKEAAL